MRTARERRRFGASAMLLLAAGAAGACSNGSGGGAAAAGCPTFDTTDCPAPPPSWSHDVQPIVNGYCATAACHGDGGVAQPLFDYTTYQGVFEHRAAIALQVDECTMPPLDASPPPPGPSSAQRQTILSWINCGAPDD